MSSYQADLVESQNQNGRDDDVSKRSAPGLDHDGVILPTGAQSPQWDPAIIYAETSKRHPLGLHVLHDPMLDEKNPVDDRSKKVDIIAIHGMPGTWDTSWTSSKTDYRWITQLLPKRLPFARVLVFGYSGTPDNAADALLADLVDDRARNKDNKGNQIILLGHSFGGYVAKQLFLSTHLFMNRQHAVLDIHSSIKGFVFLGVDHDNVAISRVIRSLDFGTLTGIIAWSAPSNFSELFVERYLEEWQSQIPRINHRFASWGGEQLATACFWETLPTTINLATRDIGILVPKEAAMLGLPWVKNFPLNRNHMNLVRYDSEDQDCRKIVDTIAGLLEGKPSLPALEHVETGLTEGRGRRILSLDGGGVRGLFSVVVLEAIMEKVREHDRPQRADAIKPCDYFDLIGGTSTGGLLAVMLGRLRMDLASCRAAYRTMSRQIFKKGYWRYKSVDFVYACLRKPWFSGEVLKAAIQDVVSQRLSLKEKEVLSLSHITAAEAPFRQLEDTNCRTLLCAVREGSEVVGRLRTYDSSAGSATPCKIWEACRATSAAPLFFPNISINGTKYWDGGLISNNPILEVYNEAKNEFPGQKLDAIISIGTGKPAYKAPPSSLFGILDYSVRQLTRTERKHVQFEQFAMQERVRDVYERLNGGADLSEIGMDDWQQLDRVEELAYVFVNSEAGRMKIDACVRRLRLAEDHVGGEGEDEEVEECTSRLGLRTPNLGVRRVHGHLPPGLEVGESL